MQLAAENRGRPGARRWAAQPPSPPPRAEWPLVPLSWQLSILATGLRAATLPCARCWAGGHPTLLPAASQHAPSVPGSCTGGFGGITLKRSISHPLMLPLFPGRCLCPAGFEGLSCHATSDPCKEHGCENGGSCVPGATNYTCLCPASYTGTRMRAGWPQTSWTGQGDVPSISLSCEG